MAQPDLPSQLKAVQAHLGCTQEHLFEQLLECAAAKETFVLSTFSDVTNGKRIRARKADQIAKALEVYTRKNNLDLNQIMRDHPSLPDIPRERGGRKVPDEC